MENYLSTKPCSSIDKKTFYRTVTQSMMNQFRQQNGIKACFFTHSQKNLDSTIRLELDCRLISLSSAECSVMYNRIMSGALITYERIRLFEIVTKYDRTRSDRRTSSPIKLSGVK